MRFLIEVNNLVKYFPVRAGILLRHVNDVKAVDGVSFKIKKGETLGLVGESGCGKTTTGRCILLLDEPTSGEILFEGKDLSRLSKEEVRKIRRHLQIVFQDPYSSLDPRMKAGDIVGEPLKVHHLAKGTELRDQVSEMFHLVGLDPSMADRYPHEFSGGQRQRIGIARALASKARFIVFDEPVSSLDVSIQAQIINLLKELREKLSLTYLFIAHDLAVVQHISDYVGVMYLGKIVEIANKFELYEDPLHPYTKALLSAVPVPDYALESQRNRTPLLGDVPSPMNPPSGCYFHPRCPVMMDVCKNMIPHLEDRGNHWVACHCV